MGKTNLVLVLGQQEQEMQLTTADSLARMIRLGGGEVRVFAPGSTPEIARVFSLAPLSQSSVESVSKQRTSEALQGFLAQALAQLVTKGIACIGEQQGWQCEACESLAEEPGRCPKCSNPLNKASFQGIILENQEIHAAVRGRLAAKALAVYPKGREISLPPQGQPLVLGFSVSQVVQPVSWLPLALEPYWAAGLCQEASAAASSKYLFLDRVLMGRVYEILVSLTALGLPWPEAISCHLPPQFIDNRSREVSPMLLAKNYGGESLRYVLLSLRSSSQDPAIAEEQLINRLNQHLANELGNLVSRTMSMVSRFSDDLIPQPEVLTRQYQDLDLRGLALQSPQRVRESIEQQDFPQAIAQIWRLVARTNKFLEETSPWQLAGNAVKAPRLNTVLYTVAETLRFVGVLLLPLLPESGEAILQQLGLGKAFELKTWGSLSQWGLLPPRTRVVSTGPLFPRILPGRPGEGDGLELILREDLSRIHLVVARVVSADRIPEAEGMLQLILYDGSQRRRVLAPLARHYKPQELSGKKLALVANLRPVENQGLVSEGEVLSTEDSEGRVSLVFIDDNVPEGSRIQC